MSRGLHIAFFGASLVSTHWNGAATYYRGLLRALYRRGHRVSFYEPDAFERQRHRDLVADPSYARVVVYPAELSALARVLHDARHADVVVKASGVGVFDRELEESVLALRAPGRAVVFWDVDAPGTLNRLKQDPEDYFRQLISEYDVVLTDGGGEPVSSAYEALGARRCIPICNGVDPDTHHPAPPDRRFEGLLGSLGDRLPDRERRVEELLFHAARAFPGERFLLGGNGWSQASHTVPENVRVLGHLYTADHNAFACTPRAVLSISRDSMAEVGFSPDRRLFEAAGSGACLFTDAWRGLVLRNRTVERKSRTATTSVPGLGQHGDDTLEQLDTAC